MVPGEGFEPSVEDPKSSALPLGHPGATSLNSSVTSAGRRSFQLSMRFAFLAALAVGCVACGSYQFPGESPEASGGPAQVSGTVLSVPCAPVQQAGQTCAGRPVPGLEIDYVVGSTVIQTKTNSSGVYAVSLPAG